jgi:hypothetical protein
MTCAGWHRAVVRMVIPTAERLRGHQQLAAIGVVGVVMLGSFLIGTQHQHLLTCQDFIVSGNHALENWAGGTGTTVP